MIVPGARGSTRFTPRPERNLIVLRFSRCFMFDLPFTPSNWRKTARFQSTDAFATRFAKLSLLQNFVYPLEVAANKKKNPSDFKRGTGFEC